MMPAGDAVAAPLMCRSSSSVSVIVLFTQGVQLRQLLSTTTAVIRVLYRPGLSRQPMYPGYPPLTPSFLTAPLLPNILPPILLAIS
jgi:hypothetical protein